MHNLQNIPQHIAIVMDGNGRWAQKNGLPRISGHRAGLESVRKVIQACAKKQISYLTIFAFSSENIKRPPEEVQHLMELFVTALRQEVNKLHRLNIKILFIGERKTFDSILQDWIDKSEKLTMNNTGLTLIIAANYGGQWDLVESVKKITKAVQSGQLSIDDINSDLINENLSLGDIPAPDLFIRTSGEQRISNFLLWHLAYTELYFTEKFWPEFDDKELDKAISYYSSRERRFGAVNHNQINTICSSKEHAVINEFV